MRKFLQLRMKSEEKLNKKRKNNWNETSGGSGLNFIEYYEKSV